MIIDDHYYDVIIVGTGAGGGTLAYKLASTGKKILILERGNFMPLEEQNRSNIDIFQRDRYHAPEQWYDHTGEPFSPQTNYAIGGNTKIYGAALLRRREKDFESVTHQAGISQNGASSMTSLSLITPKPKISIRCMARQILIAPNQLTALIIPILRSVMSLRSRRFMRRSLIKVCIHLQFPSA